MNGKELKNECSKRFGTNSGLKPALPINRNQAGYKYRLLLIKDDLSKGINPYHNSSSPSDGGSPSQPPSREADEPSLPSVASVD